MNAAGWRRLAAGAAAEAPAGVVLAMAPRVTRDIMRAVALSIALAAASPSAQADVLPAPLRGFDPSLSRVNGLHLAPSLFTEEGRQAIGITYDWEQAFELSAGEPWIALAVRADGNVAFHADVNPRDFLTTRIGFQASRGWGGTAPPDPAGAAAFAAFRREAAGFETSRELDEYLRSPGAAGYLSFLSPQLDVHVHVDGGVEVDQRILRKQWLIGLGFTGEINLWGGSAVYNVFDYPFALVRYLTSRDPWRVLGSTVPVVTVGVDRVIVASGGSRGDESFGRLRAELSFQTDLAPLSDDETLRVGATWRGYRELSPPPAVEAAGLHEFSYVEVRMSTTRGQYVSYAEGRLPFDVSAGDTYAIGWEVDW